MGNFILSFNQGFSTIAHGLKKRSPEILVTAGIIGVVYASVDACKRTLRMPEIIERHEACLNEIKENMNEDETVNTTKGVIKVSEANTQVAAHFWLEVGKLYAKPVAIGALSIGCIVGSHYILNKRYVKAVTAYATLSEVFRDYRERVKGRYGEDVERQIRFNMQPEEIEEEITDDKGKVKRKKRNIDVVDPEMVTDDFTAFYCSETSTDWSGCSKYGMMLNRQKIAQAERFATERLRSERRIYINDVLRDLGIEGRPSGQYVGWMYDETSDTSDNYVKIDVEETTFKNSKTGQLERGFILEFNADGTIIDKTYKKKGE